MRTWEPWGAGWSVGDLRVVTLVGTSRHKPQRFEVRVSLCLVVPIREVAKNIAVCEFEDWNDAWCIEILWVV